jgi:carboxylesterase type B
MNTHWANFAKKGDPGAPWPRFTLAREAQIEFGAEGPKAHDRFLKAWRDTVEAEYATPAR